MQTVGDKTVISGLRWYASDWYELLVGDVGCVGGDFSQTVVPLRVTLHGICVNHMTLNR